MVDNGRYNFIEKMGVVNKHNWGGWASCVKSKKTYHVIFSDEFDSPSYHFLRTHSYHCQAKLIFTVFAPGPAREGW